MTVYRITFGYGQGDNPDRPHPLNWGRQGGAVPELQDVPPIAHVSNWIEVEAPDELTVRSLLAGIIDGRWSMLYRPEEWDDLKSGRTWEEAFSGRCALRIEVLL